MLDWFSLFIGIIIVIVFVIINFIFNKKVDKIRVFLESNKIFFETILAVLLAIMAITLTMNSNEIASHEIELKKMENQPLLKFNVDLSEFDSENYRKDQLKISNIGTPPIDFKIDDMIFLNIVYENEDGKFERALIPINGYYGISFPSGNLTGNLINFQGQRFYDENYGNYKQIIIADDEFKDFSIKKNSTGHIYIMRFVKFEYKDIFENIHEEIYYVDPIGFGTHKLTKNEEKIISDYYYDFWFYDILDINDLSPEILYETYIENVESSRKVLFAINWDEYY